MSREMNRARAAGLGLAVPGLLALVMSATTSYAYLGQRLGITWSVERGALAVTGESAILALSVYAWATRSQGPARLALGAVLIQALPAYDLSGGTGGTVRVILGPVLLAVVLHLLLGLEVRARGEHTAGLLGQALREARERLAAWLGIGRRGADSAAIARSRAADRAVALADALATAKAGGRRARNLAARLAAAVDAAQHGLPTDAAAAAEQHVVGRVVRRRSVEGLAHIEHRHTWSLAPAAAVDSTTEDASRGVEGPSADAPVRTSDALVDEIEVSVYADQDDSAAVPAQPATAPASAPRTSAPRSRTRQAPGAGKNARPVRTDAELIEHLRDLRIGADAPLSQRAALAALGIGVPRLRALLDEHDLSLDPLPLPSPRPLHAVDSSQPDHAEQPAAAAL